MALSKPKVLKSLLLLFKKQKQKKTNKQKQTKTKEPKFNMKKPVQLTD